MDSQRPSTTRLMSSAQRTARTRFTESVSVLNPLNDPRVSDEDLALVPERLKSHTEKTASRTHQVVRRMDFKFLPMLNEDNVQHLRKRIRELRNEQNYLESWVEHYEKHKDPVVAPKEIDHSKNQLEILEAHALRLVKDDFHSRPQQKSGTEEIILYPHTSTNPGTLDVDQVESWNRGSRRRETAARIELWLQSVRSAYADGVLEPSQRQSITISDHTASLAGRPISISDSVAKDLSGDIMRACQEVDQDNQRDAGERASTSDHLSDGWVIIQRDSIGLYESFWATQDIYGWGREVAVLDHRKRSALSRWRSKIPWLAKINTKGH